MMENLFFYSAAWFIVGMIGAMVGLNALWTEGCENIFEFQIATVYFIIFVILGALGIIACLFKDRTLKPE